MPRAHRDFTLSLHRATIPVAFVGLAYFVAVGVWFALVGGPRPIGAGWHRMVLMTVLTGTAVSTFYLGLMVFGRAPWCVWCIAVHMVNLLLLLAVWRLHVSVTAPTPSPQLTRMPLTAREVTSTVAFALIIIAGLFFYRRAHLVLRDQLNRLQPYKALVLSLQQDPEFLMREYLAQPRHHIPLRAGEVAIADRPQLVVFTDFECPSCYCNALAIENQVVKFFAGDISVLVRHYPLCDACNDDVEDSVHGNACEAAFAAEAARLQGGQKAFWRMHHLLFKNRSRLNEETYRALATLIELDPDLLLRQMKEDHIRKIVKKDVAVARELGVSGTPTMFLNGRRVTKLCQSPVFWRAAARDSRPSDSDKFVSAAEPPPSATAPHVLGHAINLR